MFESAAKPTYLCILVVLAALSFFSSCTVVKDYPLNRPFVYETNVHIEGKYSTEEKKTLQTQLEQQMHDSIRVRKQRKFLFWLYLQHPPVYDSAKAAQSKIYMNALLNSMGYYRDSIRFDDTVKVVDGQQRAHIDFTVIPGKLIRLDSVWYDLLDSVAYSPAIDTLQKLTLAATPDQLVKKGDPFSKSLILAERDRLSDVYRNNGFMRFSNDLLIAVWDTVGREILSPTFDPIELAQQMELIRQRRENPTADLELRLKPNPDSSRLTRFYVGNVKIYPDFNVDSNIYNQYVSTSEILSRWKYEFISLEPRFKNRKLIRFIYLRPGEMYRQSNYLKTQNKFNSLGAWRLVTINQFQRPGEDTVDFEIRLVPADRLNTSINLDISKNQGNIASEGNLLGLGATFTLLHRNFLKAANQLTTNIRYGVELTSRLDSIQTQQVTISNTIQFPRLVPRMQWLPLDAREDARSFLSFNLGLTDRLKYYRVFTLNTSWGYEFSWNKTILGLRLPNIEYNYLQRRPLLDQLIDSNKSYKYIFNDGLIISSLLNVSIAGGKKNVANLTRLSLEESGLVTGFLQRLFPKSRLYRFVKLDAEFSQTYKIRRTALAWRLFGGVGYGLPFSNKDGGIDSTNYYMPFFRQYYAGGPNSMRGWSVRKLGPGSAIKSFNRDVAPDRFGDVRLEANGEYRFYMTQIFGFPLEGALFTDIGNVWFLRENTDFPQGDFRISRLWKDLAVDVGYGLRWDFGFLKARFDFAYKAKDPSPADPLAQNKWFYQWAPFFTNKPNKRGLQFQLGINYPF
jgi:outer membrane protein assembly factor BamA